MKKKTAIVLGATGLTGRYLLNLLLQLFCFSISKVSQRSRYLLDLLLQSDTYEKVKVFTRTPTNKQHPKLEEIVCDLLHLEQHAKDFTADEVFCCIGTTKAETPDKKRYHAIDYGIPVSAAKLAELNNIPTFSVISAMGADANSSVFYSKTKGEMEQEVLKCDIPNVLVYRPSLIYGERKDTRWAENIGTVLMKGLQFLLIGPLKKYRAIRGEDLAKALFLGTHRKGHQIILRDAFDQSSN